MKIQIMAILTFILPFTLFANIKHAPESFKNIDGTVIFVDFKNAHYNLTYDPTKKTLMAQSLIVFESFEEGMPVFDMVENPASFILDGEEVSTKIINSKDRETWFRIALKSIKPGLHTFVITSPVNQGVIFSNAGVSSAFWFTDLGDRGFLEAYLPANFEYDQYKIVMNIDFKTLKNQKIYSNGTVTAMDNNKFKIEFPETYTSSSLYYHTTYEGRYPELRFNFNSIDGRNIPAVTYASGRQTNLEEIKSKIITSLEKLESQYGPFLHNTITVFIAGNGGMEYSGATMTDIWALNHELTHSYFARGGFMPANGNAGWIDEAITTWSDNGNTTRPDLKGVVSNMAGNSQYRRYTHKDAYSVGKDFMAYLHYKYQASGGLNSFLAQLVQTESFRPMTSEEFIKKMSDYYSEDLNPIFKNHVYKGKIKTRNNQNKKAAHMKMSIPEMQQFL